MNIHICSSSWVFFHVNQPRDLAVRVDAPVTFSDGQSATAWIETRLIYRVLYLLLHGGALDSGQWDRTHLSPLLQGFQLLLVSSLFRWHLIIGFQRSNYALGFVHRHFICNSNQNIVFATNSKLLFKLFIAFTKLSFAEVVYRHCLMQCWSPIILFHVRGSFNNKTLINQSS